MEEIGASQHKSWRDGSEGGDDVCESCLQHPCRCRGGTPAGSSDEGVMVDEEATAKRALFGGKRPRSPGPLDMEMPPDLDEYFDQWRLSDQARVALCRTYANYLSAKNRVKK